MRDTVLGEPWLGGDAQVSFWGGGCWRAVKRRLQDNAAAVASLTVERGGGSLTAVKRRVQDCAAAVASLTVEPTTRGTQRVRRHGSSGPGCGEGSALSLRPLRRYDVSPWRVNCGRV